MTKKISILHPSWKRPQLAYQCYKEWTSKCEYIEYIEYILCLSEKDPTLSEYRELFKDTIVIVLTIADNGLVKQANAAAVASTGNLLICISDDFVCPEFWDTLLLAGLQGKEDYVVKTQDGLQPYIITLPIMDRMFYNRFGYIYNNLYYHMYGDQELAEVGKLLNRTITKPYYFRHNHYTTGINPKDEVNVKNDSFMMIDKETYLKREAKKFDIFILSILIPTMPERADMYSDLMSILIKQIKQNDLPVQIVIDDTPGTIGQKRNSLLSRATGEYVAFFDDDDIPADHYIYSILSAIQSHPDCCSLNGIITTDGLDPKRFIHSIKYKTWFEQEEVYYRPPNHLNVIKRSIARQFKFPEIIFGEDKDWSMRLCNSGLLKTEANIDETLYFYKYKTKK